MFIVILFNFQKSNNHPMKTLSILIIFFASVLSSRAQDSAIITTADNFLSTFDEKLKAKATFSYEDNERFNYNFVPMERKGISFRDMNAKQKEAAMKLLNVSLSEQGYSKAAGIMELEAILRSIEGRKTDDTYRDSLNYYFTIFGTPSARNSWGWRMEGHHISLNFSSVRGQIESSTPSFMGANPALVPTGKEKGKQVLKQETELGFMLINSLSKDQLTQAIFSATALPEIVTGNKRKAELLEPKGISFKLLSKDQQKMFLQLLDVYVGNYQLGFSKKLMKKIEEAGIENLSFAWAGSVKPGAGNYYRIQGPMLLIEYDNIQTNANHVHTTVRDLTNDFAEDILREHYTLEHKE
jgi:hypothetical protein